MFLINESLFLGGFQKNYAYEILNCLKNQLDVEQRNYYNDTTSKNRRARLRADPVMTRL